MKILTKNNVIVAISNIAEIVSNGIKLDNYILGIAVEDGRFIEALPTIYEVEEVPSEVKEQKYCYTKEKGFYINPDYVEIVDEKDIKKLNETILELEEKDKQKEALITNLGKQLASVKLQVLQSKGGRQ